MNITNEQYLALSAQIGLILLACRAVTKPFALGQITVLR